MGISPFHAHYKDGVISMTYDFAAEKKYTNLLYKTLVSSPKTKFWQYRLNRVYPLFYRSTRNGAELTDKRREIK